MKGNLKIDETDEAFQTIRKKYRTLQQHKKIIRLIRGKNNFFGIIVNSL